MAEIHFTSHLRNIVPDGPLLVAGATVGEVLENLLAAQPHVRSYVLDDRGSLRKHVCVFADGRRLPRDTTMAHPIGTEVYPNEGMSEPPKTSASPSACATTSGFGV